MDFQTIGRKQVPLYLTCPLDRYGCPLTSSAELYVDVGRLPEDTPTSVRNDLGMLSLLSESDFTAVSRKGFSVAFPDEIHGGKQIVLFSADLERVPYAPDFGESPVTCDWDSVSYPANYPPAHKMTYYDKTCLVHDMLESNRTQMHTALYGVERLEDTSTPLTEADKDVLEALPLLYDASYGETMSEHIRALLFEDSKYPVNVADAFTDYAQMQRLGCLCDNAGLFYLTSEERHVLAESASRNLFEGLDTIETARDVIERHGLSQAHGDTDFEFGPRFGRTDAFSVACAYAGRDVEQPGFVRKMEAEMSEAYSELVTGMADMTSYVTTSYVRSLANEILETPPDMLPDTVAKLCRQGLENESSLEDWNYKCVGAMAGGDVDMVLSLSQNLTRDIAVTQLFGCYAPRDGSAGHEDTDVILYTPQEVVKKSWLCQGIAWLSNEVRTDSVPVCTAENVQQLFEDGRANEVWHELSGIQAEWNRIAYPRFGNLDAVFDGKTVADAPVRGRECPERFEHLAQESEADCQYE